MKKSNSLLIMAGGASSRMKKSLASTSLETEVRNKAQKLHKSLIPLGPKGEPLLYYLIKNAPIVSGGSLELIDGGSKIVLASGDQLYVKSDTASSLDTVVGAVDDIST